MNLRAGRDARPVGNAAVPAAHTTPIDTRMNSSSRPCQPRTHARRFSRRGIPDQTLSPK
jgi:hypothetical protein